MISLLLMITSVGTVDTRSTDLSLSTLPKDIVISVDRPEMGDILQLLDTLEMEQTVLVGHSMGSMLSQQYLYRYGHELDAAVLSGSSSTMRSATAKASSSRPTMR